MNPNQYTFRVKPLLTPRPWNSKWNVPADAKRSAPVLRTQQIQAAEQKYISESHEPKAVFDPKNTSRAWDYDTDSHHHEYAYDKN